MGHRGVVRGAARARRRRALPRQAGRARPGRHRPARLKRRTRGLDPRQPARHRRQRSGEAHPIEPLACLRTAAALLAPPRCAICDRAVAGAARVCDECESALARLRPGQLPGGLSACGLDRVVWAATYEGVARALIAALKFRARPSLAGLAAVPLAAAIGERGVGFVVVPVPAAPLRRRRRGFDPGELIAAATAAELGLELGHCLARRSDARQVGKGRRARLESPPRVRARRAPPRRVLLVDDVLTTGGTLAACSRALRAGGCTRVEAAVFARSFGPGGPEAYHSRTET